MPLFDKSSLGLTFFQASEEEEEEEEVQGEEEEQDEEEEEAEEEEEEEEEEQAEEQAEEEAVRDKTTHTHTDLLRKTYSNKEIIEGKNKSSMIKGDLKQDWL